MLAKNWWAFEIINSQNIGQFHSIKKRSLLCMQINFFRAHIHTQKIPYEYSTNIFILKKKCFLYAFIHVLWGSSAKDLDFNFHAWNDLFVWNEPVQLKIISIELKCFDLVFEVLLYLDICKDECVDLIFDSKNHAKIKK